MAKQSMDFVTSGTYQRAIVSQGPAQWVAGTEVEVTDVAASIPGSATEDTMYSWIRAKIFCLNTAGGEAGIWEWALIKCQSADALQDLNDAAAMEKLQRESRIFGRDIQAHGTAVSGMKPIAFELYQVKLNVGEELRLVVRPILGNAAASSHILGLIEWRQVGV